MIEQFRLKDALAKYKQHFVSQIWDKEKYKRQTCIKHDKKTAVRMQSEIYNNAHTRVAGYQLTVCERCFSRSQNGKTLAREIHIWIIPVWQIPIGKIPHK